MTNCIHDHGRWGKGNQLGASHFLTPARTTGCPVRPIALV